MVPYINTVSRLARKYLSLRLFGRSDLQIIYILFKVSQIIAMQSFTYFSVEFITLPRYVKDSADLIGSYETLNFAGFNYELSFRGIDIVQHSWHYFVNDVEV